MKKFILPIICCFVFGAVSAQDEAIFSHYNVAPIIINPAYAGFTGNHQILFNARAQWTGFPDAPKTLGVQYNGPIGDIFGLGVGVVTETAARMTRIRAKLNYAFRFTVSDNVVLSTGFSTEFQQMSIGNNILGENFYQPGDGVIEDAVDGQQVFDASFGAWGSFSERTFIGFAVTNLIQARLDNIVTSQDQGSILDHYIVMAGHQFTFAQGGFTIEPSIMMRQVKDAPSQLDVNLKAGFLQDQVLAGISYRTIGAVGILLGTEINNFNLYYTFDLSTEEFQQFTSGSHEFTLAFGFSRGDSRSRSRRRR